MDGIKEKGRIVIFDIQFERNESAQFVKFFISYKDIKIEIFTSLGLFSHIPPLTNGYYVKENSIIKFVENRFIILQYNKSIAINFEKLYCLELLKLKKYYIINLRKKIKYNKIIKNNRKVSIWIIGDKHNEAGGRGEYFFRYLQNRKLKIVKAYFAIERNCSDYKRIKKLGDIIDLHSLRYLNIYLKADKIIISSINEKLIKNPFDNDQKYIKDLIHFELIYLQNRIFKDNLPEYANRFVRNYKFFISSTIKEYKSIIDSKYKYNKNNAILTGLTKNVSLEKFNIKNKKKRKIIIVPTWRKDIKGTINLINYESIYSRDFIFSTFFNFYNNLINDKVLLTFMKKYNYTGTLCLHSLFSSQWIDFKQNSIFSVFKKCNYIKILYENSLLITDYSSISFDFSFLRKPVIYTHFDYKEYINSHYPEGDFDYNLYGFGPICKDIQCTINEIIFEISNNCIFRKKYLIRMKKLLLQPKGNYNENLLKRLIDNNNDSSPNNEKLISFFLIFSLTIMASKLQIKRRIFLKLNN